LLRLWHFVSGTNVLLRRRPSGYSITKSFANNCFINNSHHNILELVRGQLVMLPSSSIISNRMEDSHIYYKTSIL
jgi:hypothetical protein